MKLLFVIDPPANLNPQKDSTIALMRAAHRRGDTVFAVGVNALALIDGGAKFIAERFDISEEDESWFQRDAAKLLSAEFFDAVLMRLEPPINAAFMEATLFLDHVVVPVFNAPRALRELNEKLAILRFPEWIPPTVVSADFQILSDFHRQHGGAVIKPLDGMGGRGVVVSPAGDKNLRALIELVGDGGRMLMAQQYLDEARAGDCRVFVINGKPADTMLVRIPRDDDHRGNMAAGGRPEARPLGKQEKIIADAIGPTLAAQGILFAGLDIIGGKLTEINITCPTGLKEVLGQSGKDLAEDILQSLEALLSGV